MSDFKAWAGRFSKELDPNVNDFNSSIAIDCRMYHEDIMVSIAHATMLGECGIIPKEDSTAIIETLYKIEKDITSGELQFDPNAEDIHMFIESVLISRIGETGKKLHTARSRNDQVATDLRLYLERQIYEIIELLSELNDVLTAIAKKHSKTIMPGYTHLQRAQPITFSQHLKAYRQMFKRDKSRLASTNNRMMNSCPLGCGALAGTTYPIDTKMVAELLGFSHPAANTLEGVSNRDFAIELASALSIIMVHLSRFCEEIILWCSWEFKFIELDDAHATGSSIMPQKKNPDIAELARGKSARVFGALQTLLVMMKGLPLAYNKDMQEDKAAIFDAVDTVKECLRVFTPMVETMKVNPDNMRKAAASGFINATDCADYLTKKGMAFRDAYKLTGEIVAHCIEVKLDLEKLSLEQYKKFSPLFEEDIFDAVNLENCTFRRKKKKAE